MPETATSSYVPSLVTPAYLLLRRAGLLDEIAWNLARLPHCTPDYVRAHIALLRFRREGLNHLIHRLRSAAPAPAAGYKGFLSLLPGEGWGES
ncbi:MAG TPA: hypothetical protein VLH85_01190 [Levilinea sp.]|nr:hypothetical protein [Levilinea sp.]